MNGLKLFWYFAKSSANEIQTEHKLYLNAFFALIFLANIETIYPFLGVGQETNTFLVLSVVSTFMTFIVLSQVVLIQKKKRGGTGELKYFVPTFLLYNLYYTFLFFAGLVLLLVPGFYVLFYFFLVPFIAVLDDSESGSYFKRSRQLVSKNLPLIIWTSVTNLLIDLSALIITTMKDSGSKVFVKLILSIPDAFLTLVLTLVSVKVFYFLKDLNVPATDNSHIS